MLSILRNWKVHNLVLTYLLFTIYNKALLINNNTIDYLIHIIVITYI